MKRIICHTSALLVIITATAGAQLGAELVTNGDFEAGSATGWTVTTGNANIVTYGSGGPGLAVGLAMAGPSSQGMPGGTYLLRTGGSNTNRLQQSVSVASLAANIDAGLVEVTASGYFGGFGGSPDTAAYKVEFQDDAGAVLSSVSIGGVNQVHRNQSTNVLLRSHRDLVPAGTRTLRLEITISDVDGGGHDALCDNLSTVLSTAQPIAPQPMGTELIVNGDFEAPVTGQPWDGWIMVGGNGPRGGYGTGSYPSFTESLAMAGPAGQGTAGLTYLFGTGGSNTNTARQTFDVTGNTAMIDGPGMDILMSGYFGGIGGSPDTARLRARYFDAIGIEIKADQIGNLTNAHRNNTTRVLQRSNRFTIPTGARTVIMDLVMTDTDGGGHQALCDNMSVRFEPYQAPPAQALGTDLIVNGGFETGVSGQPWDGWMPLNTGMSVQTYGTSSWPGLAFATCSGSGTKLISHPGNNSLLLRQAIDLRGNRAAIDANNLDIVLDGFFGGRGGSPDNSVLRAHFFHYNQALGQYVNLGASVSVGGITNYHRGNYTTLLRRRTSFRIPALTDWVNIELNVVDADGGGHDACADNIHVHLEAPVSPLPQPYGSSLLIDGGFENNLLPCNGMGGWEFAGESASRAVYGTGNAPSLVAASTWGGGSQVLRNPTYNNPRLRQGIDLRGNEADINAGIVDLLVSGFLGGAGSSPDYAWIEIRFYNGSGQIIGGNTNVGPVSNGDRGNMTTLLFRKATVNVPLGAASCLIDVRLTDANGGGHEAMADNISAILLNNQVIPAYPGTGEDLVLISSVGGPLIATAIKSIPAGGGTLTVAVDSGSGTFDYAPVILAAQLFPTGMLPGGALNGIVFDLGPTTIFLEDGTACPSCLGAPAVLPGGMFRSYAIPTNLVPGTSILIQAVALPAFATLGSPAAPLNGVFASTDGHEIRIQ